MMNTQYATCMGALLTLLCCLPAGAADKAAAKGAAKGKPKLTYDDNVVPILREKCFKCHNQDRKSGGLRLNSFSNIMMGGSSGEVIKPGDPDSSLLYKLVSHQQEPFMPPKSAAIPKENVDTIRLWIQAGAPENSGSKVVVINKPKFDISLSSIVKGKPTGPPPMPGKLVLEPVVHTRQSNALTALACSPWAPLVAVAGQKEVLLYHSDTLELLGVLPFPEGVPYILKFSRNGGLLLAGGGWNGKSGRVVVWNVTTGERIFAVGEEYDAVLAADISADQTQIALGGPSKVVRVYSTKDGKLINEIKKHTDWIYSVEFSPDGVLLATGDRNGGLFVWEANTGREYFSLRGHTAAITDLSWRDDSNVVASASEDTTIRLWEMENGGQIKSWGAHGAGVESVKYSHDARLISCGRDRVTKLWDQNGGQLRAFDALPDVALRAAITYDATRVIAGDWTGEIHVWTTADGKLAGNLTANPPTVAERLAQATKDLNARETGLQQLVTAAKASQTIAEKASADLVAAQKVANEAPAVVKQTTVALAKAKDGVAKANAALAPAQANVIAKQKAAQAQAQAAAMAQVAAAKAKDDKNLASALRKSQEIAVAAAAELAAAQKTTATLMTAAKAAADQLVFAQNAVTAANATAVAAPKNLLAATNAAKAAAAKAAADKATVDQASAGLASLRAQVEKLKAATVTKQVKK